MKVARVNGRTVSVMDSFSGLGGTTPIPGVGDLSDVDIGGIADGDTIIWDDATDTWIVGPGGGGSTDWPWFDMVVDGGLVGDGVTDDTVAFQAAIATGTAAGTRSCTFYFPPGTYLIGGALQDTGDLNAQILLPVVDVADPQITIAFLGAASPPYAVSGDQPDPGGYSILKSTLTGGTGTAAVISGGNGTWPDKNNVRVLIQDLICLGHTNPSLTFWNRFNTQGGGSKGLYITTTDWDLTPTTEPTNANAYGMKLPQWGMSNGSQEEFMVGGHYTGFLQGELADVHAIIGQCKVGFELPFSEHPSKIHAHVTAGGTIINVTGENRATIWIDVEHYTDPPFSGADDWLVTTWDLDDASDELIGDITWFSLDGVTQLPDHIFNVNGGANAQTREIGDPVSGGETPATTVESETTWGITPAVGADTEYARQDHTHGTPAEPSGGGAFLLIADTHSTPIIFGDLLLTEAGDDFLYSDG